MPGKIAVPILFAFYFFISVHSAFASNAPDPSPGYRIEINMAHFTLDTLKLGYYFGKSQYLRDTAIVSKGKFVFEGDSTLAPGVYLIVIPPDNKFMHLIITEAEQRFAMEVDLEDMVNTAKFKGSTENTIYYDYLLQLDKRRPRADELRKLMVSDSLNKDTYKKELEGIDADVRKIQDQVVAKYPTSMTAMMIRANQEVPVPEFKADTPEEEQQMRYMFYKNHYFDNFDLSDPRAMRSGLIHPKVEFYLSKLNYPYPDSQIVAMDYLLGKMLQNKEAFQYYLVHFLNESAKSKRMGMDAIYVHLIDQYYAKGLATWTEQEQLDKLKSQAESTRPLLIGKTAPNLTLYAESGQPFVLHSVEANYTVLFFWDPECGHCKKQIPFVIDFYNAYRDKGVEVVGICAKVGQDISTCWSSLKEKGMDVWTNVADQYLRSRFKTVYDIKTTPQIFVLDKDKKIVVKKIAGEDLGKVMDELLAQHSN